ncbi:MAG TPA: FtsX-like permease family protein [Aggregatilinea sp.]|uniref:ABC transporter permease n=1 Tax=Aggregatilinea sp. TaxID=2806333 RepID=UPI002CB89CE0|nr:FtsX-like permease family protein [Aggregatilinea sp.]HML21427.1 FtsX-like permease family protein [Aggregatilinea sp.]
MGIAFYLTYAVRSLRRSGQRTLLAILAVAFGVMSLVAMQILTSNIFTIIIRDPRVDLGGDLEVYQDSALTDVDIAQLDTLRESGRISDYTLSSVTYELVLKTGTETTFVGSAFGVEPDKYPMVGSLKLSAPENATLSEALSRPRTIAITIDLAERLNLHAGDIVLVTNTMGGTPQRMTIGGIISATPDHMGGRVFYTLETASLLANNARIVTGASLLVPDDPDGLTAELRNAGWGVTTPDDIRVDQKSVRDVFNFMLKGAGMLGLLVGGIGVANTMQVLLARRTTEIAILKTMGYRPRHLMLLFGLETLLIGLVGSVIGVIAAIGFSIPLTNAIENTGSVLLGWAVDVPLLLSGILTGTATALIFGVYAIMRASGVRPSLLLRQMPAFSTWKRRLQAVGVYALLALPFGVLSTLIMGSVIQGAGVVLVALAGLIVLGLVLGGALFISVRLPAPRIWLLTLARNNLKRQGGRLLFALIALFVGVFAIGFSAGTILSAREEFDVRQGSLEGENLVVFSDAAQEADLRGEIEGQKGVKSWFTVYQAELTSIQAQTGDTWRTLDVPRVEGRTDIASEPGLSVSGEPWGTRADAIYLPHTYEYQDLPTGTLIQVTGTSGTQVNLVLAGLYDYESNMISHGHSALVSQDAAKTLGGSAVSLITVAELDTSRLTAFGDHLQEALPDAMVITAADIRAVIQQMLTNLFVFAITVAGLALVAGAILIANSVGLSMIERRREIGVFKAVGYSSNHVLRAFLLEHTLLGVLASGLGMLAVEIAARILDGAEGVDISLDPLPALAIMGIATGIAVASALAVAWRPTRVRPLVVLRDE